MSGTVFSLRRSSTLTRDFPLSVAYSLTQNRTTVYLTSADPIQYLFHSAIDNNSNFHNWIMTGGLTLSEDGALSCAFVLALLSSSVRMTAKG